MAAIGPQPDRPAWALDENDVSKAMDKVPLFMTQLPEDAEENTTLAALQSLAYEGTPEEVAENFKNQGNESFKLGKRGYQNAIQYYTQAIDTNCNDATLMEQCYTNRAAVNLELGNYGKVLSDCSKALGLNPKNVKALYRSAKALNSLDKVDEAIDCCDHGLLADPENTALKTEREKAVKKKEMLEEKRRKAEERERRERERKQDIENAIQLRGIKMTNTTDTDLANEATITYDRDTESLTWPVLFLYPEYKETDFIQAFHEQDTFLDHLETMFEQPPPWDQRRQYTPEGLEVYFENDEGVRPQLVKVGKKLPLGRILSLPKYVVTDSVPKFIILPKAGAFKDEFLSRYRSQ